MLNSIEQGLTINHLIENEIYIFLNSKIKVCSVIGKLHAVMTVIKSYQLNIQIYKHYELDNFYL